MLHPFCSTVGHLLTHADHTHPPHIHFSFLPTMDAADISKCCDVNGSAVQQVHGLGRKTQHKNRRAKPKDRFFLKHNIGLGTLIIVLKKKEIKKNSSYLGFFIYHFFLASMMDPSTWPILKARSNQISQIKSQLMTVVEKKKEKNADYIN